MKPQTVVVTIHGGLTEEHAGAALGYLANELDAGKIAATLREVAAPHGVVCAAPELLDALRNCIAMLSARGGPTPEECGAAVRHARAVIAAAERS